MILARPGPRSRPGVYPRYFKIQLQKLAVEALKSRAAATANVCGQPRVDINIKLCTRQSWEEVAIRRHSETKYKSTSPLRPLIQYVDDKSRGHLIGSSFYIPGYHSHSRNGQGIVCPSMCLQHISLERVDYRGLIWHANKWKQ